MTHILAVDPGKRTGITLTYFDVNEEPELLDTWDVPGGAMGFLAWLNAYFDSLEQERTGTFIVYERFVPREGVHGVGTDASEVIGVLLSFAGDLAIPTVSQPAAGRMKAVPNKVLDKFRYFHGNPERNIKEAFRHTIWYLKNAKHLPTIKKGWGDGDVGH